MERQGEGQQVSERRGGDARRRQGTGWLGSGCDGEEDTKASEFPAPPLPWAPLLALGGRGASAPRLGLRECPEPGTAAGVILGASPSADDKPWQRPVHCGRVGSRAGSQV